LRQAYWNAIAEVGGLEVVMGREGAVSEPQAVQNLLGRLDAAEQSRGAARDALMKHRLESEHG
jgi:hypothetical protein